MPLIEVINISRPIASIFVNKYGCRVVTIAGAILASICMMASVFANSVIILYLTIGIGTVTAFVMIFKGDSILTIIIYSIEIHAIVVLIQNSL
ncbi:monocarboxylate transporter 12-B [Aphis craccivora]|uniref:Monocarboxylate transporter 12-B n=1 Tax=Aphis craccivora TaxID=307492 RepID=A0A6G0YJJ6_APHCR|nr:monocarboxylate transporter 12-B [Aphis craccivora]